MTSNASAMSGNIVKIGKICILNFNIAIEYFGTGYVIFNITEPTLIPAKETAYVTTCAINGGNPLAVMINASGQLLMRLPNDNSSMQWHDGQIVYTVD